jgi:hypothetical protein
MTLLVLIVLIFCNYLRNKFCFKRPAPDKFDRVIGTEAVDYSKAMDPIARDQLIDNELYFKQKYNIQTMTMRQYMKLEEAKAGDLSAEIIVGNQGYRIMEM